MRPALEMLLVTAVTLVGEFYLIIRLYTCSGQQLPIMMECLLKSNTKLAHSTGLQQVFIQELVEHD